MLTTKRTITDDDRQGGYTTTVNRPAPVFNFGSSRAPRADVSEYSEYEMDRIDTMRTQNRAVETEVPVRRSSAPRRAYSEEDLMPSIQTMEAAKTGRMGRESAVKRFGKKQPAEKVKVERKHLSQNAKMLIAVYAVIAVIALVLIIATSVVVSNKADKVSKLENEKGKLENTVSAQTVTIYTHTPIISPDDYEPANDNMAISFPVKQLSEKTEYKAQSNFFDRFIDFFSWLWGG